MASWHAKNILLKEKMNEETRKGEKENVRGNKNRSRKETERS